MIRITFRMIFQTPDEEEIEPPISELATSRTRHCPELARLLRTDAHDLMEEQIFQNRYLTVETFLNELAERLGLSEAVDINVSCSTGYLEKVSLGCSMWPICLR
jgi:hypothetical protein